MRQLGDLKFFTYGIPTFSKITPQHYRYADIRELLGEGYFDYMFTLVRNPFDRLASEYRLRVITATGGFWGGGPSFPVWLEAQIEAVQKNLTTLDNHLRPQWDFIADGVKVFKYEDGLQTALTKIAEEIGVAAPTELPQKLSTEEVKVNTRYDIAETERVLAFYGRDFDRFGYYKAPPRN